MLNLTNLIQHVCADLKNHIEQINSLNVFPIPDKDTGTNIYKTLKLLAGDNLKQIADNVLMSARGSSGNIIASFIIGASKSESDNLHDIFESGYNNIMESLSGIKDGTIVSSLHHSPKEYKDIIDFFTKYQDILFDDLFRSTEKNETLKKFGTVDSGILALIYIVNSTLNFLCGKELIDIQLALPKLPNKISTRYCNEYTLNNLSKFKKKILKLLGNELIFIKHNEVNKLHIHSNYPKLIYRVLKKQTIQYKIEDMENSNKRITFGGIK